MVRLSREGWEAVFTFLTFVFFVISYFFDWAWVGAYIFGSAFTLKSVWDSLREKKINVDLLMLLGAYGAAYIGKFHEGAFLLFLFNLGNTLEGFAFKISRESIRSLISIKPQRARVRRDGDWVEVPVEEVKVGDEVMVKAGERMPVDGEVIEGKASVDVSLITGEYIPEVKEAKDKVPAGSLVIDGYLKVRVINGAGESTVDRLIRLVEEAREYKSKTQTLAEWIGEKYTLLVLLTLPLVYLFFYLLTKDHSQAFYRLLVHLVVASPCAFVISTPITVMSAISAAARRGILFKGGSAVEGLFRVKWVALDKTGTITKGKPRLKKVEVLCSCHGEDEILRISGSLERYVSHPIANAITSGALERGLDLLDFREVKYEVGYGIYGNLNGSTWEISRADGIRGEGIVLRVRRDGKDEALLYLEDELKDGAKEGISALKGMGYKVILISGDRYENVEAVARKVGIEEFIANAKPEDKLRKIKELSENGGCCMVGDGINDGPALSAATFGVAMGSMVSDVAVESSDINILSDDLRYLAKAFEISKKSYSIILQNVTLSIGSIFVMVLLNLFGLVNIMLGVIGHEGTTVLVALNGLRALLLK
jgi:Cd2+/Zn2+-exporting ATPase